MEEDALFESHLKENQETDEKVNSRCFSTEVITIKSFYGMMLECFTAVQWDVEQILCGFL